MKESEIENNEINADILCNQCHHEMAQGWIHAKHNELLDGFKINVPVCDNPSCPNFGLVQFGEGIMIKGRLDNES
jgi:hypothetical protein